MRAFILAGVLLGVLVSSLVLVKQHGMFVSPDETANAVFSVLYAEEGKLALREPLNGVLGDVLHPRSVVAYGGFLVPSGFLGIPLLYGMLGKMFGTWMIPLFTAILALLGVCAWGGIVRRLYDRETAFFAALLLAIHPAWWYYTARALMPNVPFVACLLFSVWWGMAKPVKTFLPSFAKRVPQMDIFLSGIFCGAALLIRAAELPWMVAAVGVYLLVVRPRVDRRQIAWFLGAVALSLLPLLPLNASLYGSPFTFGYTATSPSATHLEELGGGIEEPESQAPVWWQGMERLASPLFPFGLHPRNAFRAVTAYGFGLFWWMTLFAGVGIFFARPDRSVAREVRARRTGVFAVFAVITIWLFVLYGSWTIHDNPDPTAISLANSYVRYWLPFFVLTTLPAALVFRAYTKRVPRGFFSWAVPGVVLLLLGGLSVQTTFFATHDGLVSVARMLAVSREIKTRLLEITEPDAVVVVDRGDKLFFPERRVLYPLRDERTYALLPRIALLAPLYYYGITFPEQDITYLNEVKLKRLGLRIDHVETYDAESLYRLTLVPSNDSL